MTKRKPINSVQKYTIYKNMQKLITVLIQHTSKEITIRKPCPGSWKECVRR